MTNILVLGKSGKGKSRVCELLSGQTGLTSPTRNSVHTEKMTGYLIPGTNLTVFDAPCFGNSDLRDCIFLQEYYLRRVEYYRGAGY